MGYVNRILAYGESRFPRGAAEGGIDELIVPDLPPEEGDRFFRGTQPAGLDTILLAAPTSPPERIRMIAARTTGFLYYVSLTGVTGAWDRLPEDLLDKVRRVRSLSAWPVCVGFGISRSDQAREVAAEADGVVVGSALVRAIEQGATARERSRAVADITRSLKGAIAK